MPDQIEIKSPQGHIEFALNLPVSFESPGYCPFGTAHPEHRGQTQVETALLEVPAERNFGAASIALETMARNSSASARSPGFPSFQAAVSNADLTRINCSDVRTSATCKNIKTPSDGAIAYARARTSNARTS
jgi:hypothetical protein